MQPEYLIVIAICLALNFILVVAKYNAARWRDLATDVVCLSLIAVFFSSSFYALVVGTFASLVLSIYIFFFPPKPMFKFDLDL